MAESDLRYVDRQGNRVSWLETAHSFHNTWLFPREIDELRAAANEQDAEHLVREAQKRIDERIETWRYYQ